MAAANASFSTSRRFPVSVADRIRVPVAEPGDVAEDLAAIARGLVNAANQDPRLASVFTTYGAATPQIFLNIDRERAETLGIAIKDIFSALQTAMGGTYVNDFNMFGRTWQVNVQADAADRATVNDVFRVRVKTAQGDLVPLQTVAGVELITAPSSIIRYNNLRSVTINGEPAAGYSSGDAIAAMEAIAKATFARLFLRMDGHGAAGKDSIGTDRLHPGAGRALRIPLSRRARRELDHSGGRPSLGGRRSVRRDGGAQDRGARQRRLRPDRPDHAGRPAG